MARLTIGQKATRVLEILMGLSNRRAAWRLAAHGMMPADVDRGWQLLRELTRGRLDLSALPTEPDPKLLLVLDAWENQWFPIVGASLRTRFPAVYAFVFNNLTQTDGAEVILSVGTLLERIDALGTLAQGAEARALLVQRGLTEPVLADARRLLADLGTFDGSFDPTRSVSEADELARETALWDWYLEWSTIARAVVDDRTALRALGFLSGRPGGELDDGTGVNPDAPVVAAPAPTNGGSVVTPRVAPGMPGSDPFDTRA